MSIQLLGTCWKILKIAHFRLILPSKMPINFEVAAGADCLVNNADISNVIFIQSCITCKKLKRKIDNYLGAYRLLGIEKLNFDPAYICR